MCRPCASSACPRSIPTTGTRLISPGEAPPAVRQKIHAAAVATLHSKEVVDAYAAVGGVVVGGTPEELAKFLAAESAKWSEVIRFAKVKLE